MLYRIVASSRLPDICFCVGDLQMCQNDFIGQKHFRIEKRCMWMFYWGTVWYEGLPFDIQVTWDLLRCILSTIENAGCYLKFCMCPGHLTRDPICWIWFVRYISSSLLNIVDNRERWMLFEVLHVSRSLDSESYILNMFCQIYIWQFHGYRWFYGPKAILFMGK